MNAIEYKKLAVLTEGPPPEGMPHGRLMHAVLGISSELGELHDALTAAHDSINIMEECGDVLWYTALLCDVLDIEMKVIDEDFARNHNTLSGFFGVVEASSVLSDKMKRIIYYRKEPEPGELQKLFGLQVVIIMTGVAIILTNHDYSTEYAMGKNIGKLRARYPSKFTEQDALNRNLEAEWKELE